MIRIVVVGEIGSGKSYVSKSFGFPVFDADKEVQKIYKTNRQLYLKLKKKLPNFIKSFPLNKKELSKSIIKDVKNLKIISKLVHPIVRGNMKTFLKRNVKKKAVVIDVPLYFENKIFNKNDFIIYIQAKKSEILKRLKLRKGFNLKIYKQLKKFNLVTSTKERNRQFVLKTILIKKD